MMRTVNTSIKLLRANLFPEVLQSSPKPWRPENRSRLWSRSNHSQGPESVVSLWHWWHSKIHSDPWWSSKSAGTRVSAESRNRHSVLEVPSPRVPFAKRLLSKCHQWTASSPPKTMVLHSAMEDVDACWDGWQDVGEVWSGDEGCLDISDGRSSKVNNSFSGRRGSAMSEDYGSTVLHVKKKENECF